MTVCRTTTLWIPAYAGMTGLAVGLACFTLTFDSSPINGEGYMVGVVLLSALRCGYCLEAGMTVLGCLACIYEMHGQNSEHIYASRRFTTS